LKVILTGAGADEFAGGYARTYKDPGRSWQDYLNTQVQRLWSHFSILQDAASAAQGTVPIAGLDRTAPVNYQHAMTMNLSSLHIYNLQNEDRMSMAHGIEARVPFLDHRIVELLASVPLGWHEQLFWDKRIVREQLGRLLPSYPEDFPKVPFVYVPGNDSVKALESCVLDRTYRPFMEKYVQPGDPLLPRDKLEKLYEVACSGCDGARRAEISLMRVMQTAIFRDSCAAGHEPPSIPASSPLQEAAPSAQGPTQVQTEIA
jgi:asparagine synthase (glutamine-hydrolysing)